MILPSIARRALHKIAPAAMAVLVTLIGHVSAAEIAPSTLETMATSRSMIWNAVAVSHGIVYLAGPRWTGSRGPSLAQLGRGGRLLPYPTAAWNKWRIGASASAAFVDVNAIRIDAKGTLWIVDTGSPQFGGNPLPHGAKLVQIDVRHKTVIRVIFLGPTIALSGSYVDDVRFHGHFAFVTDAGRPGLIVINLLDNTMRRVLENIPATTARADRPIRVSGTILNAPNEAPLRVNADPLEISPDGQSLYFGTLEGPWSAIAVRDLEDVTISPAQLRARVKPWIDLPPVGGTVMDGNGDLYFTDLDTDALKRRTVDGRITSVITDARLHWTDAPTIDEHHRIWLPVPQLDRAPVFNASRSLVNWPISLYRLALPAAP